jgi:hypothetical protein
MEKFGCEDTWDLINKFEAMGLFGCTGPDSESCYVGRSWDTIKDDETGAEFKKSVEAKIAEIVGKEVKCSTMEEAWRDG